MARHHAFLILIALLLAPTPPAAAAPEGEVPAVQKLSSYPGARGKAIEDKVAPATAAVLERALKSNLEYGQDVRPEAAPPDHELTPKVRAALKSLPPAIHKLASQYVTSVFLVEDDFGTATTEGVQDEQGRWLQCYIVLNLTALTRTANAWSEWKENSAFRADPKFRLKMTIEAAAGDTQENAIRFILIHELGHVIGLGLGVHAFWDLEGLPPATRDSPFLKVSWQPNKAGTELASRWAERFPRLSQAKFYRFDKAALPLSDAEAVYRALAQTDFPSLYGVTNIYDDFAEAFAIYVHAKLGGRPYTVEVFEGAAPRIAYTSCIVTGACPEKVKALEKVLAGK
jgi:hypothetical protein